MENILSNYVLPTLFFGIGLIMLKWRQLSFAVGIMFVTLSIIIFTWGVFTGNIDLAEIFNIWFLLLFCSTILLFFLLHLKYIKSEQSKIQKDSKVKKEEQLPQKIEEYDISKPMKTGLRLFLGRSEAGRIIRRSKK